MFFQGPNWRLPKHLQRQGGGRGRVRPFRFPISVPRLGLGLDDRYGTYICLTYSSIWLSYKILSLMIYCKNFYNIHFKNIFCVCVSSFRTIPLRNNIIRTSTQCINYSAIMTSTQCINYSAILHTNYFRRHSAGQVLLLMKIRAYRSKVLQ